MKALVKIITFCLLMTGIIIAGLLSKDFFEVQRITTYLQSLGIWAPIIFIGVYAIATVLFLPGSILTLTGGFVFGPLWGLSYNLIGATIGASIAFLVARYLASSWVEEKAKGKLKQLKQGVEHQGWRFVAVTRLIPLIPFNLLNYALGLTKISWLSYVIATFIFIIPGAAAYTYLGHLGEAAMTGEPRALVNKILIGLGLVVIVLVIPWFVKTLNKDTFKEDIGD